MFNYNYGYQQQTQTFTYVNGIEGAKSFPIAPNQTVLLMDNDNPIFYIKASNQLGQSTIRIFRFEEIKEEQPSAKYVSIDDFNKFKQEMLEAVKGVKDNG